MTLARKNIVRAALHAKKPFSALEMHAMFLGRGHSIDKVTVYRELAFLEEQGILRGLTFKDAVKRYEIVTDSHRHHLICTRCNKVEDVEMENDLNVLERQIEEEKSFRVRSHSLEFYGLCSRCA